MNVSNIKFKGQSINSKNWFYGSLTVDSFGNSQILVPKESMINRFTFFNVKKETVCMFTCFYDRNGDEIYENDVVKYFEKEYVVKYNDETRMFVIVDVDLEEISLLGIDKENLLLIKNKFDYDF